MSEESLEQRQREMRERMAQERKDQKMPDAKIKSKPSSSKAEPGPAPETLNSPEPTVTKEPNGSTTVSRQDLYRLVWREPIIRLAIRFGVSDVAVAKTCRKHKIPLPGRGYWARIAAGEKIAKAPLPTEDGR